VLWCRVRQVEAHLEYLDVLLAAVHCYRPDAAAVADDSVAADVALEVRQVLYGVVVNVVSGHRALTRLAAANPLLVQSLLADVRAAAECDADGADHHMVDLFVTLCESLCDDLQVNRLHSRRRAADGDVTNIWDDAPPSPVPSSRPLWSADVGGVPSHSELCGGLAALQRSFDSRSPTWLRAEQCVLVLQGRAGDRGTGMPLWKK
jgi:hypothetical protein